MDLYTEKERERRILYDLVWFIADIIFFIIYMGILIILNLSLFYTLMCIIIFVMCYIVIKFSTINKFDRYYNRRLFNQHIKNPGTKMLVDMLWDGDHSNTATAIQSLRNNGNFNDGSLNGIRISDNCRIIKLDISDFDLRQSKFALVDFIATELSRVKLNNVFMGVCWLDGAIAIDVDFTDGELQQCSMIYTNWTRAKFNNATINDSELTEAILNYANFSGANLQNTGLRYASLEGTIFNEKTKLPDSTDENPIFWTPEINMEKYTNPEHPNFWEPDYSKTRWLLDAGIEWQERARAREDLSLRWQKYIGTNVPNDTDS